MLKRMTQLVLVLVAAYLALALLVFLTADRLIFPAPPAGYTGAELEGFRTVRTADGVSLAMVHLPHPDARYTILLSHGNGEDLASISPMLRELHRMGFAVVAYDYRGYGASEGRPDVQGVLTDARAVFDHVTDELGVPPERIILYGRSVGSGPAVHVAAQERVAGLVLESGFTTAFRVVTRVPVFPFDRFHNLRLLPAVQAPVLLIHGRRDRVVPFSHGERLYRAASQPKYRLWLDDAGHNDVWLVGGAEVRSALRSFVERL